MKLKYKIIYNYDLFRQRFTYGIFITAGIFLIIQVSAVVAIGNYKQSQICASPFEIRQWSEALETAQNAYIGHISEIESKLGTESEQVEYWKNAYLYLKRQQEEQLIEGE